MYLYPKKVKKNKNDKKQIIVFVLLFAFTISLNAQLVPQYTQYMYNTISINPAYKGDGGTNIVGLHRNQWLGIQSSPKTYMFSVNSAIREDKMNVGVSIIHTEFGQSKDTYFNLDYSYTLPVSEYDKISFGLKGGIVNRNVNFQNLDFFQDNDPAFQGNLRSQIRPSFGLGVYYNKEAFYLGLSALNILENYQLNTNVSGDDEAFSHDITSYLIMGYVYNLNESLKLKPTLLLKYIPNIPLQVDVSLNGLINDKIVVGMGYRFKAAFSALLGFHINDSTVLGLSYDRDSNKRIAIIDGNNGTIEVFFKFNLFNEAKGTSKDKMPPRFY